MQMQKNQGRYKSPLSVWTPFGLWRIDWYYIRFYLKVFFIILVALAALVGIGDLFQRFDDFVMLSRREERELPDMVMLFLRYYGTFVPQLIFQYMFPVIMLLAASITATASFAGPRGNNEYIVIRSAGVPVLRAFVPLLIPALTVAIMFQAGRDFFLPTMVRESAAILGQLRNRISSPTSVSLIGDKGFQAAAIGSFAPGQLAHNIILEVRDTGGFIRGDAARGDNDFVAYRAALAKLEPAPGGGYQWTPLERAERHVYTQYARRSVPWTESVPTGMTPAMIERQTLGDAVSTWHDLLLMQKDNMGAKFEMHWRLADPLACVLLVLWGAGVCMGRMLRGGSSSYIQAITISMLAAAIFYCLRLAGRSLWESGVLTAELGVWLPIAAAAVVALPIAFLMER